jgi:hypothetical protein
MRKQEMIREAQAIEHIKSEEGVSGEEATCSLRLAVAKKIAYSQSIPTTPVNNVRGYYLQTHSMEAKHYVSGINENIVMDCEAVCDLAFRIWEIRYRIVHEPMRVALDKLMVGTSKSNLNEAQSEMVAKANERAAMRISAILPSCGTA